MSVLVTLRPMSQVDPDSTWFKYGSGTRWQALADNDDATGLLSPTASGVATEHFNLTHAGIPAGARIEWIRQRLRFSTTVAGDAIRSYLGDAGSDYPYESATVVADGARRDWYGAQVARNPLARRDWGLNATPEQEELRWHGVGITDGVSTGPFLAEVYAEVSYRRIHTVDVTAPTGVGGVTKPTIRWTVTAPDNPSQPQAVYRVVVFNASDVTGFGFDPWTSTPVLESGQVRVASARSWLANNFLQAGDYRVYVFVSQPWPGTQGDWWASDFADFTVQVVPLPKPYVAVVPDPDNARMEIRYFGTLNMASLHAYDMENNTGGWLGSGCTVAPWLYPGGTQYELDSYALEVTPSAPGACAIRQPRYQVAPGITYAMTIKAMRSVAPATVQNAHVELLFYDAGGAPIGSAVAGADVALGTAMAQLSVTATAPANAATVEPWVRFVNSAAGQKFYVDVFYLAPHGLVTTGPGGTTTDPIIEAQRSDDGGVTWQDDVHFFFWRADFLNALRSDPNTDVVTRYYIKASSYLQEAVFYDYSCRRAPAKVVYRIRTQAQGTDGLFRASAWTQTEPAVLPIKGEWLKDPKNPLNNISPVVSERPLTRPYPQSTEDVLGDDKTVTSTDGPKAWRGSLTISTKTLDEWDALQYLLELGYALLYQDVFGRQWHIRVGENAEHNQLRAVLDAADTRFPVRHLHRVKFPWAETRPVVFS